MAERDLLDRLEKATGPDRELDIAIADAAMGKPHAFIVEGTFLFDRGVKRTARWAVYGNAADNDSIFVEAPKVTASLDAAIALVERTEGACYRIEKIPPSGIEAFGGQFWATAGVPGEQEDATGPTAPITLLRALFRARLSRGEQP